MAHAFARRRGYAGDIGDYRFGHLAADVLGGLFLVGAADLAHHHDPFRSRIALEHLQAVDEIQAAHRVAADAYATRLAKPAGRSLVHYFVSKGAGTGNNAYAAGLVDETGHDAQLAFPGRDHTGAIRTDQPAIVRLQRRLYPHHVEHRNSLGNTDDQANARIGGGHNGVGRRRRRHEHEAGISAGRLHGLFGGVVYRQPQTFLTAAPGSGARQDPGAVFQALRGVKPALAAGQALADRAGVGVHKDTHAAISTAIRAAAARSEAAVTVSSLASSMVRAWPALVPSRRATTGTSTLASRTA